MPINYIIMRKEKYWDDENPVFYTSPNNPNFSLVTIGSKVLVEKELGGEIKFLGHGEINSIDAPSDNGNIRYTIHLRNFVKFYPPRMKTYEIRKNIKTIPGYRWYDSIRPLNKDIFENIIQVCSQENWHLFLEDMYPSVGGEAKLDDLLIESESESLEFKSSLLTSTEPSSRIITIQHEIEKSSGKEKQIWQGRLKEAEIEQRNYLEDAVIKTIAAFLNTHGGTLLIGIDDDKRILGIEKDYASFFDRRNWDGWLQHLRNLVSTYLDTVVSSQLHAESIFRKGKTVAKIDIPPSPRPIFVKSRDGKSEEAFYVRNFNATDRLKISQINDYISSRWSK